MSSKTFEVITDRIIELLNKGTIPWKKSWSEGAGLGEHQNLISQHQYRGINALMTGCQGFESKYWATYKQISEIGGQVRKGEKGTPIVYWAFGTDEKSDGTEKSWAFAKYSTVFNIDQCDGIDSVKAIASKRKADRIKFEPIEACENLLKNLHGRGPIVQHVEQRGWYKPGLDLVNMPKKESFNSVPEYYSVLFHELTHSTGHASRLARDGIVSKNHFGGHAYSKEELIAEMGAAFLCGMTGIETATIENSAAYIQSWLSVLKGDSKMVMQAASAAQKATDWIVGKESK